MSIDCNASNGPCECDDCIADAVFNGKDFSCDCGDPQCCDCYPEDPENPVPGSIADLLEEFATDPQWQ
jgi:hypothetical protein